MPHRQTSAPITLLIALLGSSAFSFAIAADPASPVPAQAGAGGMSTTVLPAPAAGNPANGAQLPVPGLWRSKGHAVLLPQGADGSAVHAGAPANTTTTGH